MNIAKFLLVFVSLLCCLSCSSQQENQSSVQDSVLKSIAADELYVDWNALLQENMTNMALKVYDLEGIIKMLEDKKADISITQVPKEAFLAFKGGIEYYRINSELEKLSKQVTQKYPMMRDFTQEDFLKLKEYCTKCNSVDTRKLLNNMRKN